MKRVHSVLVAASLCLVYLGCGGGGGEGGPTEPGDGSPTGSIRVSASTGGQDVDPDGYRAVVDDTASERDLSVDGSVTFTGIAPGSHTVTLEGAAVNCPVSGEITKDVSVTADAQTSVSFDVECREAPRVLFVWDSDPSGIYSAKVNGTEVELLHEGPGEVEDLSLSPDRTHVVYNAGSSVTVLRIGDGHTEDLGAADNSTRGSLTWSPDGDRVAFVRDNDLQIYRPDGTFVRRVSGEDTGSGTGLLWKASWSPADGWIAVQAEHGSGTGTSSNVIRLIRPDGSSRNTVSEAGGVSELREEGREQVWSADGTRLAYTSYRLGSTRKDVYVVEITENGTSAGETQVTSDPATDSWPAVSPDGEHVAFLSNREDSELGRELYLVRADGTDLRQLTDQDRGLENPLWSDGGEIILVVNDGGGLGAVRADGTNFQWVVGGTTAPVSTASWY